MRVGILGFGLIGGSIARSLHAADPGAWTVAAWSPTGRGPDAAVEAGIIDRRAGSAGDAIAGADLVVLAAPPLDCLELIDAIAPGDGATVTDVVSTKAAIGARADRAGFRFVGGHPMAGREVGGFEAATGDLFVGRPWVVVPGARAAAADVARVEALARACGADPIRMDAATHDDAVAAISHLPLVLAAALVEAVTGAADWPAARDLAASGWRDMTRLARGDVDMGAGIAATNAEPLARRILAVREVLDGWLRDLGQGTDGTADVAGLRARLAAARAAIDEAR